MSFAPRKFLTPQCVNMGPSLTTSSVILMVLLAVTFILLIVAAVYAYQKTPATTDSTGAVVPASDAMTPENQKKVKGLLVASLILSGICIVIVMWNLIISGKVRKCLDGNTPGQ